MGWLKDKWTKFRNHHSEAERLRMENLRLIATAPDATLEQATIRLRDIAMKKGSSSTHPKVKAD